MIPVTGVLILIILVMTAWWTRRVKDMTVRAVWVVPLWGGLAALGFTGIAGVYYFNELRIYDRCVSMAERSIGGRQQSEQLYDTVDVVTGTNEYTSTAVLSGRPSLREAIDINLPVLDPNDCEKP